MNKQALEALSGKCHECIEAWKKENWHKPLDIELGDFIQHCRMYGGDDIQHLYEEVWDNADEDDTILYSVDGGDYSEAVKSLRLTLACNESIETGKTIYFE